LEAFKRSRRISEREGGRLAAVEERKFVRGRLLAEIWELTREERNATRGLR
jgi:hypothetical protein